jgi:hypothetical protein
MSVKDIMFIGRDYCTQHSKQTVYLHYQSFIDKYPNSTYQYVLIKEPIHEYTEEEIVARYKRSITSDISISKLAQKLVFAKEFQNSFMNMIDDVKTYPNFTCKTSPLSNGSCQLPDLTVVWEINRIAPTLCGIIFENIIATLLSIPLNVDYLGDRMVNLDSTFDLCNNIVGVLDRNFLKLSLMDKCKVMDDTIYVVDCRGSGIGGTKSGLSTKLNESHFISKWHYLVFASMLHFIKYDFTGDVLEDALRVLEYIMKNLKYMENYKETMGRTSVIKRMKKENNIEHGKYGKRKDLRGEVDFISDECIWDIKSYKVDQVDTWFAQLYLYSLLFGERKSMKIINVYTNQVHSFEVVGGSKKKMKPVYEAECDEAVDECDEVCDEAECDEVCDEAVDTAECDEVECDEVECDEVECDEVECDECDEGDTEATN